MTISGASGINHQIPSLNLKETVNKAKINTTIEEIKSTGQITKAQFKDLAKNVTGGKDELSSFLKQIDPKLDVDKLKSFALFTRDKNIKVNIAPEKLEAMKGKLEEVVHQTKSSQDDFSMLIGKMEGSLDKLKNKGDSISRSGFAEITVGAKVGPELGELGDALLDNADIGKLGAEVGAKVGTAIKTSAEMTTEGKVKISVESKIYGGAEGEATKVNKREGTVAYVSKTEYTFNSVEDAKKFLQNKGKGFIEGQDYTKEKTKETATETNKVLKSGIKVVEKTSKQGWLSQLFGGISLSRQVMSLKTSSSKSEGDTKTYSLDTKSGLVLTKKNSSTNLSINTKQDPVTKKNIFSGMFSVDFDLNKIKNNQDKAGLVDKLTSRFNKIVETMHKNGEKIHIDSSNIKKYISGTLDKLIEKRDQFFGEGGKLHGLSQGRELKLSADVGFGAEVSAKWGNMIRLNIPLESVPVPDGKQPKLKVDDSTTMVQVFRDRGAEFGAKFEVGAPLIAKVEAGFKVGGESQKLTKLTDAVKH